MAYSTKNSSSPCLELAIEGERFCREGEWNKGIIYFLKALTIGTDDLNCLSTIYCQLGNAYFHLQDYTKSLEYHRWDLALARRTGDLVGELQASGNLGNVLKMLGKYQESILCFNRQLDIANHCEDRKAQARALYNLGNLYHTQGKKWARNSGQSDPGEFPISAAAAQRTAIEYYKENLKLVRELGDRPAEGRVFGSLGNAHYLLGNFAEAISCHQERLNIANEFGDLDAQRRAHSNMGNAYIFQADFNLAVKHYRQALQLSIHLKDVALQAQACYSLGNSYTLLRDPEVALVFHLRHLVIARRLGDLVGEGRAHWSLANAYTALGRYDKGLRCARRHCQIAQKLHDYTGFMTAQLMICEIRNLIIRNATTATTTAIQPPQSQQTVTTTANDTEIKLCNIEQNSHHFLHKTNTNTNNLVNTNLIKNFPLDKDIKFSTASIDTTTTTVTSDPHTDIIDNNNNNNNHCLQITEHYPNNSSVGLYEIGNVLDNDKNNLINIPNCSTITDSIYSTLNQINLEDDFIDYDDLNLDTDLENELMANHNGILETVEFVTLTEDGQTVVSQMGCLDVPIPPSYETNHENMAEFYTNSPVFRPNLNQFNEKFIPMNHIDIEDNLETIESINQQTCRNSNRSNNLIYQFNTNTNLITPSMTNTPFSTTTQTSSSEATATETTTTTTTTTTNMITSDLNNLSTDRHLHSHQIDEEEEQSGDQQELFFSFLLKSQSRRMDEQRCCLRNQITTTNNNMTTATTTTTTVTTTNTSNSVIRSTNTNTTTNPITTSFVHSNSVQTYPIEDNNYNIPDETFFDLIEGVQGDRMDDQRASLPAFPGLRSGPGLQLLENTRFSGSNNVMFASTASSTGSDGGMPEPKPRCFSNNFSRMHGTQSSTGPDASHEVDDEFLDMIFRLQTCTRLNDQRSNLPDPLYRTNSHFSSEHNTTTNTTTTTTTTTSNNNNNITNTTTSNTTTTTTNDNNNNNNNTLSINRSMTSTVPDEDFFALIQRVQSTRLDEQRCNPPPYSSLPPTSSSSSCVQNSIRLCNNDNND